MYLDKNGLPIDPAVWNYQDMESEFQGRDNRMVNTMMVNGDYYWSNGPGRVNWTGDADDKKNATFAPFNPAQKGGSGYFTQNGVPNERLQQEKRDMIFRLSAMRKYY